MSELSKFQQRLAEKRRLEAEAAAPKPSEFHDAIPDQPFERSPEDAALDKIVSDIDIIDAYSRWCGKMTPEVRNGQTEGIKISCPIPGHRDSNPSAWINTSKQTWFCATCGQGGDAYDIAAYHFNYPVPGYKDGARFHDLRRDMAKSFGYTFIKPPGAKTPIPVAPQEAEQTEEAYQPDSSASPGVEEKADTEGGATVTSIAGDPDEDFQIAFPTLDWADIVAPDTFLDTYMKCCIIDDVPEEYHFWNGLIALGLSVGRDVTLFDSVPVYGNLFVCLLGNTGDGKSRSFGHLDRLVKAALPGKWDDPADKGAYVFSAPASAEILIQSFSKPVPDPANPKVIAFYAPVKGLVEFNELSQLVGRGNRQGNVLKPTLMQFYDAVATVSTSSMTSGKKEAVNPFACCFTTTQPRSLKELISQSDAGSGFLNRWVFASGKQKKRVAIGGARVDINPAVAPLKAIQAWMGFGKEITWTEAAAERFTQLFETVIHPQQQRDESDFLMRIDLLMKKLMLLFCINEKLNEVTLDIVERVYKMYPYLLAAYEIPAAEMGNSKAWQCVDTIRRLAKKSKNPAGVSFRELRQSIGKKFEPVLIEKMLNYMVNMGELALSEAQNKTGPKTIRYRYVG